MTPFPVNPDGNSRLLGLHALTGTLGDRTASSPAPGLAIRRLGRQPLILFGVPLLINRRVRGAPASVRRRGTRAGGGR